MPIYFRDFPFKVPFFTGKTHQSTHRKSSKMGTYLHQLQRSPELPGAWERHWRHHQWPRSPGRAKYPSSNEMMAVACCGHGHSMKFSVLNFSQCLVSDDLMLDIFWCTCDEKCLIILYFGFLRPWCFHKIPHLRPDQRHHFRFLQWWDLGIFMAGVRKLRRKTGLRWRPDRRWPPSIPRPPLEVQQLPGQKNGGKIAENDSKIWIDNDRTWINHEAVHITSMGLP